MARERNDRSTSRNAGRDRQMRASSHTDEPRGRPGGETRTMERGSTEREGMERADTERGGMERSGMERGGVERGSKRDTSREQEHYRGLQRRPGGRGEGLAALSPFSFMRRFTEDMDRLFDDFGFGRGWLAPSLGEFSPSGLSELGRAVWSPQIEVFRRGDELVVRADLPGIRKEDVHVDVQQDQLVIQGERSWEEEGDREGGFRTERYYGSFHRVVPLPQGVNAEQARATYRDGVLEVTMPAPQERSRGRRLPVE